MKPAPESPRDPHFPHAEGHLHPVLAYANDHAGLLTKEGHRGYSTALRPWDWSVADPTSRPSRAPSTLADCALSDSHAGWLDRGLLISALEWVSTPPRHALLRYAGAHLPPFAAALVCSLDATWDLTCFVSQAFARLAWIIWPPTRGAVAPPREGDPML